MYDSIRFIEVNSEKFGQLLKYKSEAKKKQGSAVQAAMIQELRADLPQSTVNIKWKNLSYIRYLQEFTELPVRENEYMAILNMANIILDECEDQLSSQNEIDIVMKEALLDEYLFKCSSQYFDSWYLKPKVNLPSYVGKALLAYNSHLYENLFDKDRLKPFRLTEENEVGYEDIDDPTSYYFIGPELTSQIYLFFAKTKDKSKSHEYFFNVFSRAINGDSIIIVDL